MEDLGRLREMQATYEAMRMRYQMLLQLQQLLADLPGQVVPSPDGRGVRIAVRDERELEQLMIRRALIQSLMEVEDRTPKGPPPVAEADLARLASRTLAASAGDCVVCMEDMTVGTVVCELPCKHLFCRHCAFSWLKQHRTCPVCRYEVDFSSGGAADGRRKVDPRVNRVPTTHAMAELPPEAGVDGPRGGPLPPRRMASNAPVPTRIPEELRRLPTPLAATQREAAQRQRDMAAFHQRVAAVASNGEMVNLNESDDDDDEFGMIYHPPSFRTREGGSVRATGGAARTVRQLRDMQLPATEPPPPAGASRPFARTTYDTEDARPTELRPQPRPPAQAPRQSARPQPQMAAPSPPPPAPTAPPAPSRAEQQRTILRERREREAQLLNPTPSAQSPVRGGRSSSQVTAARPAVARSTGSIPTGTSDASATGQQGSSTRGQSVLSQSRALPTASLRSGLAGLRNTSRGRNS